MIRFIYNIIMYVIFANIGFLIILQDNFNSAFEIIKYGVIVFIFHAVVLGLLEEKKKYYYYKLRQNMRGKKFIDNN